MKYTIILEPQEEGGYTVTVPALPGCISEGDAKEEAIEIYQLYFHVQFRGASGIHPL